MNNTWRERLAAECARTSQSKVAAAIGYSPTVVNQVLGGSYPGDLKAVEGAFMRATVACPVLGEIPGNRCLEEQHRPFASTNTQRASRSSAHAATASTAVSPRRPHET
jgi:hypothetical protein